MLRQLSGTFSKTKEKRDERFTIASRAEQMRKAIARLERVFSEIEACDSTALTTRRGPEQKTLEAPIEGTLASIFEHDATEYHNMLWIPELSRQVLS